MPVCRELGVGVVCYSPIGRGMLAGKYSKPEDIDPNDFRSKNPRFLGEAFAKVGHMLAALVRLSTQAAAEHPVLCRSRLA